MTDSPTPRPTPDITVLVPVYNEAGNILPLAEEIVGALEGALSYEIIFIDDGSDDEGPAELKAVKQRFAEVRVIEHGSRAGKSAALWTGLAFARGTWIQTLDGDGQNDPADIVRLWRHLNEGNGERLTPALGIIAGQRTSRNDGAFKWLQSRIANGIRRFMLKDGTRDTGCGFKLIRARAFRQVPCFDGMHRFLPALVRRAGYEVMEFPVTDRPRKAGQSKYGFFDRLTAGIFDLFGVMWLIRRGTFPSNISGDV